MKLLVTGGRRYYNYGAFDKAMQNLIKHYNRRPSIIINGGATGADQLAQRWGETNNIHVATVPAIWINGPGAGPARNRAMLILAPDLCLSMPGGNGTANMRNLCELAHIPVIKPYG